MLNIIIMEGRIVRQLELRHTKDSIPVCSFVLECDRPAKSTDKKADYIDVVAWRDYAVFVAKELRVGDEIGVIGTLTSRPWKDRLGNSRKATEIKVERLFAPGEIKSLDQLLDGNYPVFAEIGVDDELPF